MTTIAEIRDVLRYLYRTAPWAQRALSVGRPSICPFHVLLEHVPDGATVLDIGCGSGVFLNLLAHQARFAGGVGIDSSQRGITAAQAASAVLRSPRTVEFRRLSIDEGLPTGAFSVVSMIDVLHHVPTVSQRRALEEAAGRVAPGGVLLYKDVGTRPLWRAWASRLHDLVIAREWIHIVAPGTVKAWMRALGFELEHERTINMLWYGHELLVFRNAAHGHGVAA